MSTEDTVVGLTKSVIKKLDEKRRCIEIFLDLTMAFDTVSIPIHLNKLEIIGTRSRLRAFQQLPIGPQPIC